MTTPTHPSTIPMTITGAAVAMDLAMDIHRRSTATGRLPLTDAVAEILSAAIARAGKGTLRPIGTGEFMRFSSTVLDAGGRDRVRTMAEKAGIPTVELCGRLYASAIAGQTAFPTFADEAAAVAWMRDAANPIGLRTAVALAFIVAWFGASKIGAILGKLETAGGRTASLHGLDDAHDAAAIIRFVGEHHRQTITGPARGRFLSMVDKTDRFPWADTVSVGRPVPVKKLAGTCGVSLPPALDAAVDRLRDDRRISWGELIRKAVTEDIDAIGSFSATDIVPGPKADGVGHNSNLTFDGDAVVRACRARCDCTVGDVLRTVLARYVARHDAAAVAPVRRGVTRMPAPTIVDRRGAAPAKQVQSSVRAPAPAAVKLVAGTPVDALLVLAEPVLDAILTADPALSDAADRAWIVGKLRRRAQDAERAIRDDIPRMVECLRRMSA